VEEMCEILAILVSSDEVLVTGELDDGVVD
jgi:hypothetical protein